MKKSAAGTADGEGWGFFGARGKKSGGAQLGVAKWRRRADVDPLDFAYILVDFERPDFCPSRVECLFFHVARS